MVWLTRLGFSPDGRIRRCEDIDENAGTGDRSEMRKQGIGENTGTGDRSSVVML